MRYRLLVSAVAVVLFVITYLIGQGRVESILSQTEELRKQYQKVARLSAEYKKLSRLGSSQRTGTLEGGVLTFVQNISNELGVSDKINSIKPVPGTNEVVEVFYNRMTLRSIVDLFVRIRDYRNLRVRSFTITKRYDAPELADLRIQIEKMK
ncbi:MAG: hypothetical protein GXO99_00690 [Nitrospirae bacterium]|nr:hypothetical protein [Nitrospirota bacterium]